MVTEVSHDFVVMKEIAKARAKVYQLLSILYIRPPDAELLKLLSDWIFSIKSSQELYKLLPKKIVNGLSKIDDYLRNIGKGHDKELIAPLSVEFTRLLRGLKPSYSPPPPYESVYRENSDRVFGESTFQVYKEYRHFGLNLADRFKGEPPDHISFELNFMSHLCRKEAEAWNKGEYSEGLSLLRVERDFLEQHLIQWVSLLSKKINSEDKLGFYSAIAELTDGWISFDYEQITMQEV